MVHNWTAAEARAQCKAGCYNRSIRLASGDELAFADVGDAQGQPVLWFWGLSGHRHLALLLHETALAHRLRVLCVDRPGQGGSTPSPSDTRALDWPGIVTELADQLGLQQFRVVGQSCGAVFAMACALPSQPTCARTVGPVVLVSPWVPLASGAGSARCNRLARLPGLVHSVIGSVLSGSVPQYIGGEAPPNWWARSAVPGPQSPEEWAAWGSGLNAGVAEAIAAARQREGGMQSVAADLRLCLGSGQPLGFDYHEVTKRVVVYHGDQDTLVPVTAAQWLANNLRDCSLTVCKDATHQMYIMREPLAQVCEQIAAAAPLGLLSST